MEQMTTLLRGLLCVVVQRVEELSGGGRVVHVSTASVDAAACPSCRVVSTSCKAKVTTRPRDIPYGVVGLELLWHKRR